MDVRDHDHLLRMSITDALQALTAGKIEAAIVILDDALNDKFSIENMGILFPVKEEETEAVPDLTLTERKRKRSSGGWVELKTINGCGPYAYKRWRDGGRTRSEYIGKVVS